MGFPPLGRGFPAQGTWRYFSEDLANAARHPYILGSFSACKEPGGDSPQVLCWNARVTSYFPDSSMPIDF